jgi:hypothetical protein
MPLKEIDEPKSKDKGKSKEKAQPKTDGETDAWKILPDGSKKRQGRKLPYEAQLHQLLEEISGGVMLLDSFSGQVISARAEELAYGYARLAKEDDRVRAFFAKALTASAYSAVLLPTVLTLAPILWHFGLLPGRVGVPLTLMSGAMPITREQEQQQQEQAKAAAEQARATHPHGEAKGDGGSTD